MAKVAIYCGHGTQTDGTWDSGTTYNGETEAALMLPITTAAANVLKASGVTVYTDQRNEINMIKQVSQANAKGADVFVSVHCDYSKAPTGTMPLYVSANGKKFAETINKHVMAGMGIGTRGVTKRTDLYELNATDMPSCIFETGSIKADLATLKNAEAYGKAIANGILAYLGMSATKPSAPAKPKPKAKVIDVDGYWGKETTKYTQKFLGSYADGYVDGQYQGERSNLPAAHLSSWRFTLSHQGSPMIRKLQIYLNGKGFDAGTVDGLMGVNTIRAMQKFLVAKGYSVGIYGADGIMGSKTVEAWQKFINAQFK